MRPDIRFSPASLLATLRGRWRALFHRESLERELDEEVRFHLEMEAEKQVRAGLTPTEARRAALIAFGGVDRVQEAHRDARGTRLIEDTLVDIRYAARGLARAPGSAAVSVATLATAVAIGTLCFSAVNGFFYRPLPVPGGGDLAAVFTSDFSGPERLGASSYADLVDFANGTASIAEIAGEARVSLGIGLGDHVVMAQGAVVSPGYFRILRVQPSLGSFPGGPPQDAPAIVLSYTLWRRAFGADSSLVGRQVRANGQPLTVAAISSPEFRGTSREIADDFWIDGAVAPLVLPRDHFIQSRASRRFHALARLRDGVQFGALNARLGVIASNLLQAYPDSWLDTTGHGRRVIAMLERDAHLHQVPRAERLLVLGGVIAMGLGLLGIACLNLASLQLARGASRRREIATRLALGAGRGRLIRQLLAECALIVAAGAAGGVVMARTVAAVVSHYRPIPLPTIDLSLDWRALGFIFTGLVLALLVFGLLPAIQTVRPDLLTALKGGDDLGAGGVRIGRLRSGLIATQIALSLMFTATAGMVALALIRAASQGREEARKVLLARVNFLPEAGDSARVRALTEELVAGIATIPGVEGASAADFIPTRGARRTVGAEVRDSRGRTRRINLDANTVLPAYFRVMGLSVVRGRDFGARDARGVNPVVIVSKALSDALWHSEDPIGKQIMIQATGRSEPAEVVGVVADPIGQGPATAESFPGLLYLPMQLGAEAELVLHARVPEARAAVAGQIMQRLRAENARLVSPEVITLDEYYDRMVLPQRLMAHGAGVLGALQLLLAVAGLSGLVAYVTALRRREVGIRTALGASQGSVLRLVMRQGTRLMTVGAGVGVALSLLVARVVSLSLPVTLPMMLGALLVAAAILAATGAIAMWLPARRALSVSPADALRVA